METKRYEQKVYIASGSCIFRKTKDLYGGLSNMASGFPLRVNNITILSAEALYQACRFPHLPHVQEKIMLEKSPMSAKMVGKPFRDNSRPDWENVKVKVMRWCLRVKLAQNFIDFGRLLESTYDNVIIEDSSKDDFWGAIRDKQDGNVLKGTNALGRLLMELRQFYNENRYSYEMFVVEPLSIPEFKIMGQPIEIIDERERFISHIKHNTRYHEVENLITLEPVNKKDITNERVKATIRKIEKKMVPIVKESKKITRHATRPVVTKRKSKVDGQPELPF